MHRTVIFLNFIHLKLLDMDLKASEPDMSCLYNLLIRGRSDLQGVDSAPCFKETMVQ